MAQLYSVPKAHAEFNSHFRPGISTQDKWCRRVNQISRTTREFDDDVLNLELWWHVKMEALKYHSDGPVKIHEKSVWLGVGVLLRLGMVK